MSRRSPARWLAPLALVAFVIALFAVVSGGSPDGERAADEPAPAATTEETSGGEAAQEEDEGGKGSGRKRKTYTVKAGDTPSQIATETGVSLEQIEELNPDLDPQLLSPGEKIRIRP